MIANSNKAKLFNDSGCLNRKALSLFISSGLSEDEIREVEEHLSSCPLCTDALEGIRLLSERQDYLAEEKVPFGTTDEVAGSIRKKTSRPVDLEAHTEMINSKLRKRYGYFPGRDKAAARSPRLRNFLVPAAASILILVGIISYFYFFFPDNNELALLDENEVKAPEPGTSATIGGVFNEETHEKGAMETSKSDKGADPGSAEDVENLPEEQIDMADELARVDEQLTLTDHEEDMTKPEAAVEKETITAFAREEVAGAGMDIEDGRVVSRAKSGKKAMAETNEMIVVYDQDASFPGGMDSLYSFLDRFMKYSVVDQQAADTLVLVQFTVSKRGDFNRFNFIQGAGEEVNAEVLRVLKVMPDWIPAIKEGKNVEEVVTLPVYLKTK